MSGQQTRQWILANPPKADPIFSGDDATFKLQTTTLPALGPNQVLVKVLHLSNDPAQRGWIQHGVDPERLYTEPVKKGDVMRAFGVCEVVQSNVDNLKPGQLVIGTAGKRTVFLPCDYALERIQHTTLEAAKASTFSYCRLNIAPSALLFYR